jgi:hypothetical protein
MDQIRHGNTRQNKTKQDRTRRNKTREEGRRIDGINGSIFNLILGWMGSLQRLVKDAKTR